jgi:hypothetical protein
MNGRSSELNLEEILREDLVCLSASEKNAFDLLIAPINLYSRGHAKLKPENWCAMPFLIAGLHHLIKGS